MVASTFLLIALVLLNGFFAASELAFIAVNETKLMSQAKVGERKAERVLKLKRTPNKFLSTIQIGVSLASIFSGVFASEAFATLFTEWLLSFFALSYGTVKTFSMVIVTLITSYLMLVFGELVPKRIALANPEKVAYFSVYPLSALARVTTPIVKLLSLSTNATLKLVGINPKEIKEAVTEEEIRAMVIAGDISPIEKEMIENIFKFDDMPVARIMTHRAEIVAIDSKESFDTILDRIHKERYTRYPVYEGTIDNIIGIIHLRELLRYIQVSKKEDFKIHNLLKKPYFVPDSKRADEMFRELQKQQTHMGIVIDEYGKTAGLVTMENLIEEVMGEISDEYDVQKEFEIITLSDDEYLVAGAYMLDDLQDLLKIRLPTEKYDTVNGFMIGQLGKIPTEEDLIENRSVFIYKGYRFLIEELENKMIAKARITKKSLEVDESSSNDYP